MRGWESSAEGKEEGQEYDPLPGLLKHRWQTPDSFDDNKVSIVLGRLEQDGFKFKYDGAWGSWPLDYLNSVISHYYYVEAVRASLKKNTKRDESDALSKKLLASAWSKQEQIENAKVAKAGADMYELFG